MTYTVLARRYRSQNFDALIGQEPIARTLRNAIEQDRVAHAYLFCGTRGVGKTSAARVFARMLNGRPDAGDDDEVNAAIMQGRDSDVIEIDAASNTGVDNARELIANCAYRPMRGAYKIYIIDEVHMLSNSAFNALLKTMEEPPSHVKFILCTTDAHKVPATIQSRCQRFDFRNIPASKIAAHLSSVVENEGREAEPELLQAIARLGNGSMRDALSLLDRVIATGEERLTRASLEALLGLPMRERFDLAVSAIAAGDAKAVLEHTDGLLESGTSADQLIESLVERFRDLLVLCVCGSDTPLVELSPEARKAEAELAGSFDPASLTYMIALCESVQRSIRLSSAPRAVMDAMMVRLALSDRFADAAGVVRGSALTGASPKKQTGRR